LAGACSASEYRNGRATDPLVALQLLLEQTMRPMFGVVVIIAGVVMFTRADSASVSVVRDRISDARDARTDVYGNEILPAVADYMVDVYGEMYERHAPNTALLELTEPET
jgi:hypothetical protein